MSAVAIATPTTGIPESYEELCRAHLPRPIHDEGERLETLRHAQAMIGRDLNDDQADYLQLLISLISEYEDSIRERPPHDPLGALAFLMEEHRMNQRDLAEVLGLSAAAISRIVSGARSITTRHAARLGARFSVSPGLFVPTDGD